MFSRWIWGIFKVQIQSEWGHEIVQLIGHINVEDLVDIYKGGCGPFCVSLLTYRHLKRLMED